MRSVVGKPGRIYFKSPETPPALRMRIFNSCLHPSWPSSAETELNGLKFMVLIFLILMVADFGLTFTQRMIMEYAGHKVMHDMRVRLFDHILEQSMAFFTRQPVARLVTRVTNDVQNMHELFTTFVSMVFKDIFILIGIATILLVLDWRVGIAGFAVLPIVVFAAVRFSIRARTVFRAHEGQGRRD